MGVLRGSGRSDARSAGRRRVRCLGAALLVASGLAGCISSAPARSAAPGSPSLAFGARTTLRTANTPADLSPAGGGAEAGPRRPNILFVLTDDLSLDLVSYMPAVRSLERRGMTFENYFVSDSLCCPSRASIFTGQFPHDTGVYDNTGPNGGIGAFYAHGEERHSFNLALQRDGYRTAMMGKYLNRYLQDGSPVPATFVPPGWNEWDVAGWGYPEYDYPMNQDGRVVNFGHRPRAYLTNVLTRRGVSFVDHAATAHRPFFLELAPFTPHAPYVPAPRDKPSFPGLQAPHPPNFDVLPTDAPRWLAGHPPLSTPQLEQIDSVFRRRVQDVQSIDRMLSRIEATVAAHGLTRDTYVIFSSDNGLHTGEYRLMPGKLTAYDTDIHVPLVVAGPGIAPGSASKAMTENVDLAATFTAIGGRSMGSDGHSLLGLLHGGSAAGWRNAILVEHRGPDIAATDPDAQTGLSGNPTTYEAMRTPRVLYVEYDDGERELYDLRSDPFELHNLAGTLTSAQLSRLHNELAALETCHGAGACWAAGHVAGGPTG